MKRLNFISILLLCMLTLLCGCKKEVKVTKKETIPAPDRNTANRIAEYVAKECVKKHISESQGSVSYQIFRVQEKYRDDHKDHYIIAASPETVEQYDNKGVLFFKKYSSVIKLEINVIRSSVEHYSDSQSAKINVEIGEKKAVFNDVSGISLYKLFPMEKNEFDQEEYPSIKETYQAALPPVGYDLEYILKKSEKVPENIIRKTVSLNWEPTTKKWECREYNIDSFPEEIVAEPFCMEDFSEENLKEEMANKGFRPDHERYYSAEDEEIITRIRDGWLFTNGKWYSPQQLKRREVRQDIKEISDIISQGEFLKESTLETYNIYKLRNRIAGFKDEDDKLSEFLVNVNRLIAILTLKYNLQILVDQIKETDEIKVLRELFRVSCEHCYHGDEKCHICISRKTKASDSKASPNLTYDQCRHKGLKKCDICKGEVVGCPHCLYSTEKCPACHGQTYYLHSDTDALLQQSINEIKDFCNRFEEEFQEIEITSKKKIITEDEQKVITKIGELISKKTFMKQPMLDMFNLYNFRNAISSFKDSEDREAERFLQNVNALIAIGSLYYNLEVLRNKFTSNDEIRIIMGLYAVPCPYCYHGASICQICDSFSDKSEKMYEPTYKWLLVYGGYLEWGIVYERRWKPYELCRHRGKEKCGKCFGEGICPKCRGEGVIDYGGITQRCDLKCPYCINPQPCKRCKSYTYRIRPTIKRLSQQCITEIKAYCEKNKAQ